MSVAPASGSNIVGIAGAGTWQLPEGRPGQMLAVGLAGLVLIVAWFGVAAPVLGWYDARCDQLAAMRQEAVHIDMLRRSLPALRREAAGGATQSGSQNLLPGGSDAIAGANLQSILQNLAVQAGVSLDSVTMLPAQPVGSLRRVGVELGVTTTWPALIALLAAIETAQPRMIVGNLSLTAAAADPGEAVPLQADFTAASFRAGDAP